MNSSPENTFYDILWTETSAVDHRRAELDLIEQALQRNALLFSKLVEHSIDPIIVISHDKVCFVNLAAEKAFGRSAEELLGIELGYPIVSDDGAEITILSKSGAVLTAEMRIIEIEWKSEPAYLVTMRDITAYKCRERILEQDIEEQTNLLLNELAERERTEKALRGSEQRFRAMIEHSADCILLLAIDGSIMYESPPVKRIVGFEPAERIGQNFYDRVHPDDLTYVINLANVLLQTPVETITGEFRYRHKDSSYRWIEATASNLLAEPNVQAIVINYHDITRRKWTEACQATQWAVTRILAEAAAIEEAMPRLLQAICNKLNWQFGEVWQVDPTTSALRCTYFWCEPALAATEFAQLSSTLTFARGEGVPGYVWESGQQAWLTDYTSDIRAFRTDAAIEADLCSCIAFPVGSGTTCNDVMCFFSRIPSSVDQALSELMIDIGCQIGQFLNRKRAEAALVAERASLARRVTERTAELSIANAELSRAVRTKDEFLATMSHELRTPLNAILGLTESLQEYTYGPLNEEQIKTLNVIEESGRHLLSLINDILDLSKIEASKMDLQFDLIPVESICKASLKFIKQQAHSKHIRTSFSLDDTMAAVYADERRLKQILVNLLSNATKFTPEEGQIGLEVTTDPRWHVIRFTIWDTGIGISDENMSRLFQPFVQLDSSLSRQHEGTGLGLALVARLTDLHGGSVTVESEAGKGSRFTVSLPWEETMTIASLNTFLDVDATYTRSAPLLSPAPACSLVSSIEGRLILLAEDNEATIQLFTDYLNRKGYRTIVARNGLEAIDRVKEERPALILMDIQMPGMDGMEATRLIRTDETLAHIPIIALTSLAMPGDRERCLDAGVNEYLSKPVSLHTLVHAIETCLKHICERVSKAV